MAVAKKKRYDAAFKAKVATAALRGDKTLSALASQYEINPTVIAGWKKELLSRAKELFEAPAAKSKTEGAASDEKLKDLHAKIGQLTVENDFLSVKLRRWIES
jgi:transposase